MSEKRNTFKNYEFEEIGSYKGVEKTMEDFNIESDEYLIDFDRFDADTFSIDMY